ncbi:GtrA family protein [Klebsiella pneumoniae]|uniref:GtrA family protein n=1 Tax=Klebsiella pneumoniae TaxID=573 RepID=UPI00217EBC12|nr:GtrA family protein [Klebsiella pneumoniae]MCS6411451.1 GtrA family protein [Klebsiella pneumoniae]
MLNLFTRYFSVGIVNTAIHWLVFITAYYMFDTSQALANFGAFCIAVTFSFFANAKWTFDSEATTIRYMMYVFFMGAMASSIGWMGDTMNFKPIATIILFSGISLVCGFLFSKFIIFKDAK